MARYQYWAEAAGVNLLKFLSFVPVDESQISCGECSAIYFHWTDQLFCNHHLFQTSVSINYKFGLDFLFRLTVSLDMEYFRDVDMIEHF